jgi:dihydroneopterin aldolase
MTDDVLEFNEILERVTSMPVQTRVRLVERVLATVTEELMELNKTPRQSAYGALAHLGKAPTSEEIDQVRREMMGNFTHEEIG